MGAQEDGLRQLRRRSLAGSAFARLHQRLQPGPTAQVSGISGNDARRKCLTAGFLSGGSTSQPPWRGAVHSVSWTCDAAIRASAIG